MKNILQDVNQVTMEDILESFLVYHNLLYNQISRFSYGGTNTRIEEGSVNYCLQSKVHKEAIRSKYPPNKLYVVTRSVSGATPHDLSATKGTIVGVIKSQNPMGDTSKWFVDNGTMKGFLESQYLELSDESKLIEDNASAACTNIPMDLMSLDSPVKEAKRYSADVQSLYSNTSDEQDAPPNYENIAGTEAPPRQLYENFRDQVSCGTNFRRALFFNGKSIDVCSFPVCLCALRFS